MSWWRDLWDSRFSRRVPQCYVRVEPSFVEWSQPNDPASFEPIGATACTPAPVLMHPPEPPPYLIVPTEVGRLLLSGQALIPGVPDMSLYQLSFVGAAIWKFVRKPPQRMDA